VHSEPDVAVFTDLWLTSVQTHTNLDIGPFRPGVGGEVPLGIHCRRHRVLPPPESDEERVALRVHLPPAVSGEGRAEDALVFG